MAIKIGDEVIPNCAVGGLIHGKKYKVTGSSYNKMNELLIKIEGSSLDYHHSYFNVASPHVPSPIRTRREIVPGVYGKICVNERGAGYGIESITMLPTVNSDELREAAHILNQIAEVLEENANDME